MTEVEVSVVMPCLNEAETLPVCIEAARRGLEAANVAGEIIIADNGSSDGSPDVARQLGARVVHVASRGYGNALMGGIAAARGDYVVMGDADGSYDFTEIPRFVASLREGTDLVMGCRLPSGGGTVMPDAMPFLHRFLGNPVFSLICRVGFAVPIHDVHCGLRAFRRDFQASLNQRCTGMEFADEMVLAACFADGRVSELPITLHPDQRTAHGPHIRTFRDGWRTLRFLLMYSPRWLFFVPGSVLISLGIAGYGVVFPGTSIGGVNLGLNTLLVASLAILIGFQLLLFGAFTRAFGIAEGFLPIDRFWRRAFELVTLEKGIMVGMLAALSGAAGIGVALYQWRATGFGNLDYEVARTWVVPGVTLVALGVQAIFSSFFLSILGLKRT